MFVNKQLIQCKPEVIEAHVCGQSYKRFNSERGLGRPQNVAGVERTPI